MRQTVFKTSGYIFLVVFAIMWFPGIAFSQQMPLYSQYMMNGFLINPAMAGTEDYIPIRLTTRHQWQGIDDAPRTYSLSAHVRLSGGVMGVGGYVFNDSYGPIRSTGIQGSYSYHIDLLRIDSKLALGLSVSAFQYSVDERNLRKFDEDDPVLSESVESSFAPDASFGAYLYRKNYFAGVSISQLFQFDVGINDQNENKMIRHYFLMGGYRFPVGEKAELEPSVLLKGTEKTPGQIDINLKTFILRDYWVGVSYRSGKAIVGIVGVKYKMVYFGYAFDYTFSNLSSFTTGSHEVMIGVNLREGKEQGSRLL